MRLLQLCAFLDMYIALRGECQESFFNVGRMFHQIGLLQNAVHFYQKALTCPVPVKGGESSHEKVRRGKSNNGKKERSDPNEDTSLTTFSLISFARPIALPHAAFTSSIVWLLLLLLTVDRYAPHAHTHAEHF